MMPQNPSAFRERKLRFDASKPVRFSRIRHCLIASLPQNRVRFSRPVKENQGLTIVAKAKKTLSAYRLSRKGRKGSGETTPPKARQGGSGTAPPYHCTSQDVAVEDELHAASVVETCIAIEPLRARLREVHPASTSRCGTSLPPHSHDNPDTDRQYHDGARNVRRCERSRSDHVSSQMTPAGHAHHEPQRR
jgi:hypothetical protein